MCLDADTMPTASSTFVGAVKYAAPDNSAPASNQTTPLNDYDVIVPEVPPCGGGGMSCAPRPPRRYHDLEVLSADFDLVGGCDAEHNSYSDDDYDDIMNDDFRNNHDSFEDGDISEEEQKSPNNQNRKTGLYVKWMNSRGMRIHWYSVCVSLLWKKLVINGNVEKSSGQ